MVKASVKLSSIFIVLNLIKLGRHITAKPIIKHELTLSSQTFDLTNEQATKCTASTAKVQSTSQVNCGTVNVHVVRMSRVARNSVYRS